MTPISTDTMRDTGEIHLQNERIARCGMSERGNECV